jgi:transcriptional regulator with XRE-family HTH domain
MTSTSVGTYLRFLRRQSGLSQHDLAMILGGVSVSQVSRHEQSRSLPGILTAFGYQVVFQQPASDIFPGLYHSVEIAVEHRLLELEHEFCAGSADSMSARDRTQRLKRDWFESRFRSLEE